MSDDRDSYKPIACGLHSEYELVIIRRVNLRLGWMDAHGQEHIGNILPLDIYTRDHAEYLIVRNIDGQQHEIRLDRIISSNVREISAG
jgi:transcriptional antiterminator Rof (Rho-off)